jgi:hypothetical protein
VQAKPSSCLTQEQTVGILREIAENGSFAEYCIAIDPKYQLEWFHAEIAKELERGYQQLMAGEDVRLMIFMPPRHGKSDTATQKFPSWVLGKSPSIPIVVSSYSAELATDFGQKTRDIMQSDTYSAMFSTRLRADARAKGRWITKEGGGYTAVGVGGALTGRGFKIGIIDDPFKNREEADSLVIREARDGWYKSTFSTREEGNSMIVFILTRWHDDDLAGRVLKASREAKARGEAYDDWKIIEYKAIATEDDEHRKSGEALWPAKFSLEKLLKKRAEMGSYEFSALYQQNPIDEENRKFKQAWYKYREFSKVLQLDTYNVMTIDPRGKDDIDQGTDYIGITLNFIDREGKWNVICYRTKLSATDLVDLMFTNWKRYNLHKIGIEDNQFTQALKSVWEEEMLRRGVYMDVELLKHGGHSKALRIEALVPRYERGGIYHIKHGDTNFCKDLESELSMFPKATNDDASDSLAYQVQLAQRPEDDVGSGEAYNQSLADRDVTATWN